MTGMVYIEVQIDTANPNAVPRLMELLARAETIGKDDFGHLHSTDLTVIDGNGRVTWGAAVACDEQDVRDGELSALVRLTNESGRDDELVACNVYAIAARLLHAAGITDPYSGWALSPARASALAEDLGGLSRDIGAGLAPRDWVVTQVQHTCERLMRSWLSHVEDPAAAVSWPAALDRIRSWLSPAT